MPKAGPSRRWWLLPGGILALALLAAAGAGLDRMVLSDFKVCPGYYPPPNQTQMKAFLEGARAQSISETQHLVTQAKLRTFRENGEEELAVETPQCVYNSAQRSVSSASPIRLLAAEGKFSLTGDGFIWQQTNVSASLGFSNATSGSLLISNHVHSSVHPDLLAGGELHAPPGSAPPRTGLEIFSDQFDYAADTGVYRRNVHVTGTNLDLTAGLLAIVVPRHEHQLQSVTADQNVVADYKETHASGERATYSPLTGLLEISGHPAWRSEGKEGRGDLIIIDTNKIYLAKGHAFLKGPAQGLAVSSLLAATNAPASASTSNTLVEVSCDSYELRTNRAVFQKDVRLNELVGGEVKGTLTCAQLTATYAGTNLEQMLAEHQVVIRSEDKQLTAARAVYEATNGILDLIDHPAWQDGPRQGQGDSIQINTKRKEMLVDRHALMRLPASQMGSMALSPSATNRPPASQAEPEKFALLTSDAYRVGQDTAVFNRNVRIDHPDIVMSCQEMTVDLPPAGGRVGRIVADHAVEFEFTDSKGAKTHGSGNRAVYTFSVSGAITNELIELTGNPTRLIQTNSVQILTNIAGVQQTVTVLKTNFVMVGEAVLFDRVHNTIRSHCGIEVPTSALSTNTGGAWAPPKKKKDKPQK